MTADADSTLAPHAGVPPSTWRGWAKVAAPVRAFLASPQGRTWSELDRWARGQQMPGHLLVNAVCWLEGQGLVVDVGTRKAPLWRATGPA